MRQINHYGDQAGSHNLHPVMSFAFSPWEKRPRFVEQRDAVNNPIRSPWRKTKPTKDEATAAKMANGGIDRTAQEIRDEVLDAHKYDVVRDVPWLPDPVPFDTPSWKFALYTTLGATPDDIAHRIARDDLELNDQLVCHAQIRNGIKKRIDDWLKRNHGGFQWLEDRQKLRARTTGLKEGTHNFATAVITGIANRREPVSALGYFFVRCSCVILACLH